MQGIFLADANPIRLQRHCPGNQPWMRLPLKILKLFEWLLDQYLLHRTAKILLLMGSHSVRRYTSFSPHARPFAIEKQPSMFGNNIHGYAEYSSGGTIVQLAIVSC